MAFDLLCLIYFIEYHSLSIHFPTDDPGLSYFMA